MNETGSIFDQGFIKSLALEVASVVIARHPKQSSDRIGGNARLAPVSIVRPSGFIADLLDEAGDNAKVA